MANTAKIAGLTPVKYLNGANWTGQANLYHIDSGDTNTYYVGDPVSLKAGTATISGEDVGLQTLNVGQVGAANVGVIVGVGTNARGGPLINPADLTKTWAPATKTVPYYALVVDDPNVVFEITEYTSSAGSNFTVAATSKNANFALAAPAAGVYVSGSYLDHNTAAATTATLNLKLLGLAQKYDNGIWNTYGLYAKWLCLINNHYYGVYGGRTGI